MKKLLVICAAIVITGCSSMGGASSPMGSGTMGIGSSSMSAGTSGGSGPDISAGKAGTGYRTSDPTSSVYFGA